MLYRHAEGTTIFQGEMFQSGKSQLWMPLVLMQESQIFQQQGAASAKGSGRQNKQETQQVGMRLALRGGRRTWCALLLLDSTRDRCVWGSTEPNASAR